MQNLQSILALTPGWIHKTVIQTAPAFCSLHFVKPIRDGFMLRRPLFWFSEDIFLCRARFVLHPENQTSQSDKQDHTLRSDLCAALNATESRRCRAFTDFFLHLLFAQQISPFACSASDKAHCWMLSLSDILFFLCCLRPSKSAYSNSKALAGATLLFPRHSIKNRCLSA